MTPALMKFDPATGVERPYPSEAAQWRTYNGSTAWLFDPYSGERRKAQDVGTDLQGHLILTTGPLKASNAELEPEDFYITTYQVEVGGFGRQQVVVRVTHIPSGLTSECGTERSVHANKHIAFHSLVNLINKTRDMQNARGV